MAGSRLEAFGTIFTRTRGLLVSGAVKDHDRPIWYDVYAAFPPHIEPKKYRPVPTNEVRAIFYPEDNVRAKFYSTFGSQSVIDLSNNEVGYKSLSQKYVDKYMEIKSNTVDKERSEAELFRETEKVLLDEGILTISKPNRDNKTELSKTQPVREVHHRQTASIDVTKIMED